MKKLAQITNVYNNHEVYLIDEDQKDFCAFVNKLNGQPPTQNKLEKLDRMIEYAIVEPYSTTKPFIVATTTDIPALDL
ncbi:MAG TPA: hypothetical protein VN026_04315 [Bacteroidia bacterium]|jgi:hypothetical protein|nr:hypothetical protein [Bacteroidia bacterium]